MRSYWEKNQFSFFNNIVIGSGLAGLFTALNLKQKFPNERVLILSKGWIGRGASTKNAGFACMGSITELEDDLSHSSEEEIITLFEMRYKGLQIMRQELGNVPIGYEDNGSYELLENANDLAKIKRWNKALQFIERKDAFSVANMNKFSFKGFAAAIQNELEGSIDTGKMIYTLLQKVQSLGVEFMQQTELNAFEKIGDRYVLQTSQDIQLSCERLILCTNAFTKELLPTLDIKPGRGQVIITKPIENLPIKGIYHFDQGYYYFREIDGRVLFGGGRQLDIEGEETHQLGGNKLILEDLKRKLKENILPHIAFEIDYSWSGIMAFHENKKPICKEVQDNLFVLAGFGGMGVALAPFMAKELVGKI